MKKVIYIIALLAFTSTMADTNKVIIEKICSAEFYQFANKMWPDIDVRFILFNEDSKGNKQFSPAVEQTEHEYAMYSLGSIQNVPVGIYCTSTTNPTNKLNSIRIETLNEFNIILLHIEYNPVGIPGFKNLAFDYSH